MRKKRVFMSYLFTLLFGLVVYYFTYPAISLTNPFFFLFLFEVFIVYCILTFFFTFRFTLQDLFSFKRGKWIMPTFIVLLVPTILLLIFLINFFLSPVFQSNQYYKRIEVDTSGDFESEVREVDFQKLPLLDRDSTLKIGDRTMGQMSELVSQFDVSSMYTQINFQEEILRVTPLEYNGFIKWITNRKDGIKAYITVNSTSWEAHLIKMKKGMKYAPSAYFQENLYRKLQMSYPTKIFDSVNFEIDNDGNPFWVASVIQYVGIGLRRDVCGVVIFDPVTGKSKYYDVDKVPSWVDHVYEADLILEQVADWGKYKKGFWNSIISQKGVVETTTGYNYLAQDDDIYLYTGITSVISDESNIGFILTNMRTKETKYYSVAGAEEYSAMDSAKGQVQQMNYTSTFPLLINLHGRPTYLVSLKDNAGLVKMYAFVDVVDYQKVVVSDASRGIQAACDAYLSEIGEDRPSSYKEKNIIVHSIQTVMIDGNTTYYFLDEDGQKYKVSIKVKKDFLPFLQDNDLIHIYYSDDGEVITIMEID